MYAASGGSRYGAPQHLPVTESAPADPVSPYAVSKLVGELYLRAFADMYGMAPICLALANVYGPRQNVRGEAGVIAAFGSAMAAGRNVTVYGDGTATRDYVYVDDVVEAFVCAAHASLETSGVYNIGTGVCTSVTEVHRLIAAMVDGAQPPCHAEARTGELQAIALDATKAAVELGWTPAVDLSEGIERTMAWLVRDAVAEQPPVVVA